MDSSISRVNGSAYTARENDDFVFTVRHECINYGPTHWPRSAGNSDDTHREMDWKLCSLHLTLQLLTRSRHVEYLMLMSEVLYI